MSDLSTGLSDRVGDNYRGPAAEAYFDYQSKDAASWGQLLAKRFQPAVRPSDFLVDFGCGLGYTLLALIAERKMGVEVNPHSRAVASDLGLATVERAEDLPAGEVDVIISNHALEHTRQPFTELVALRHALRSEGTLNLIVPIDDWRAQRSPAGTDPNHHLFTWTPLLLANLLTEAGYRVHRSSVVHHNWPGRATTTLSKALPSQVFTQVCRATSYLRRRREVHAVATPLGKN